MDDPESDYHNFSQLPSSSHRLPTLNGVEALLDVIERHKPISTNLLALDSILSDSHTATSLDGGVPRGGLTEIYGPPGSGKTHFAIQLVANILRKEETARAVWIDTSSQIPSPRLRKLLHAPLLERDGSAVQPLNSSNGGEGQHLSLDERLSYLYIPSFTHLLSILMHPTPEFVPEETKLLVIDDFSGTVTTGLPQDERLGTAPARDTRQPLSRDDIISKSIAIRRAAMLSAISAGLARLAASRSMAVVVLNKATSNRKSGSKIAMMKSVLSSQQWNENVEARIVLYRMFWPKVDMSTLNRDARRRQRKRLTHALRVAEVERTGGKDVRAEGVRFVILNNRLQAVNPPQTIEVTHAVLPSSPPASSEDNEEAMGNLGLDDAIEDDDQSVQMPEDVPPSSIPQGSSQVSKRKIAEIADSEDEDEIGDYPRSRRPPVSRMSNGFLPSSQLSMDEPASSSPASQNHQLDTDVNGDVDETLSKD